MAACQAGAVTSAQLLAAGVSRAQARALTQAEMLVPTARGVYLMAGSVRDWRCSMWTELLASGVESFACRRSAAALWELDGVPCRYVEVAVPKGRHSRRPNTIRLTTVAARDVVERHGIRVTTVPRTLLDLGRVVPATTVERSVECALRRRLVTVGDLTELVASGRSPGGRVLRDVLRLRPEGAPPTESDPETRFVQVVRAMALPFPRRQFVVILRGRKYRLDFAWPAIRLAVEIDGGSVHTANTLGGDLYRQNQILLDGWFIVRFTPYMVDRRVQMVERDLRAAWELRTLGVSVYPPEGGSR